jgi:electron transfer flavoprotein-quinone oxidoreductase
MDKVKSIVVGAGPAGSACAYTLAKKGIDVVLLERGQAPGEKNVAGFVLFTPVLEHLIPDWRDRAPTERNITRFDTVDTDGKDFRLFQNYYSSYRDDPICFSAFRSKFDAWLAAEAESVGAELVTGVTVTDLIVDDDRVVGVRVDDDELYADVVVGADGVNSLVAEKSGLIEKRDPSQMYLVVKEILDLPPDVINQRFRLREDEGSTLEGEFPFDVENLVTLYTNKDSLSMALDCVVGDLVTEQARAHELLEEVKNHPCLHPLLEGASLREYQAHLETINREPLKPECMYGDGVLLCGEAGRVIDMWGTGVPPAMLSGMMAAHTVEMAINENDYGAKALRRYVDFLDSTSLWRTMFSSGQQEKYHKIVADIMESSQRSYYDFTVREPYPLWKEMYLRVGRDFTPPFLRLLMTGCVRLTSLCSTLYNQMRKRFKGRYYEWKKDYERQPRDCRHDLSLSEP